MFTLNDKIRHARGVADLLIARAALWRTGADQRRIASMVSRRTDAIIRFAVQNSPFYRDFYREVLHDGTGKLQELPVLDKATMMENLSRIFTDSRLGQDGIDEHIASGRAGERYLGEYRIIASSGSTGRRGLFLYNRREWSTLLATFWRWTDMVGMSPRPGRRRIAIIGAPSDFHLTYRMSSSLGIGAYHTLYLKAGEPISYLTGKLADFCPELLLTYPTICCMLAVEQIEGRLNIHPRVIATGGELRTPNVTALIQQAWGVRPHDFYAMTETGLMAGECAENGAMHMFNDLTIVEVVDTNYNPVPTGERGSRLLITNLFLRTQPLIRYEVSDLLTMSSSPCPCGSPWPVIQSIDGRADDLLWMNDHNGQEISIHPMQLQSVILSHTGVRTYQIRQHDDVVQVHIVTDCRADADRRIYELHAQLSHKFDQLGVRRPTLTVENVDAIAPEAGAGGKVKLVISNRHPPRASLSHDHGR